MDTLPDDLFHVIIKMIDPVYYFNIYCISQRFRKCLNFIYTTHRNYDHDILANMIYKNDNITSSNIINLCSVQYQCKNGGFYFYSSSTVRVVLQFNITYKSSDLSKILNAACYYKDLQIIKHLKKVNDIVPYCYDLLKNMDSGDIFDYLFKKLLKHGSENHLIRMAERILTNWKYDLYKKIIMTGRMQHVDNLLPLLIKRNQLDLTSLLFSSNQIVRTKKLYLIARKHSSSKEMTILIDQIFNII